MNQDQKNTPAAVAAGPAGVPAWWQGWLLVFITLIAYLPVRQAGFIWDDDAYVTNNPLLTAPDGLWRIWFSLDCPSQYFPLTYTTFYLEHPLWGLNPTGYHVINLLLHTANALLVWRVLARLGVPGAWLAAAIFAVHPVQVESVAWISERKNVLMGFFFLVALWAWIKFVAGEVRHPRWFYGLALVCQALALTAKTTACTLPAALLLVLWLKKMPVTGRRLVQVAPFVVLGLGMGLVTVWWERHNQGTQGETFALGPMERVLIASRGLWFYAGKLLWPAPLTFNYPRWTISVEDPRAYGWLVVTAGLGIVIYRMRGRTGRSVEVAAVFFAATLSPVLGFLMLYTFLYSFVADHYQYLACIGPIALAAAGMKLGLERVAAGKLWLPPILAALLLTGLGTLTRQQGGIYRNDQTLWQETLRSNPDSWMAHVNLGNHLALEGQVDGAISHFRQALQINPNQWDAHISYGTALAQTGDLAGAINQYEAALRSKPDDELARVNLGIALWQSGRSAEAIPHFQKVLERAPNDLTAQKYLAWVLATNPEAALRNGARAVELARQANILTGGENPGVLHTLAAALAETGRFPEALATAQRALLRAEANPRLAGQIQYEMTFYQAGRPLRVSQ